MIAIIIDIIIYETTVREFDQYICLSIPDEDLIKKIMRCVWFSVLGGPLMIY